MKCAALFLSLLLVSPTRGLNGLGWSEEKSNIENLYKKQDYSNFIDPLREMLENNKDRTDVIEWIERKALEDGDVAMIYLYLRNWHKAYNNNVAIKPDEWNVIGMLIIITILRIYQDETICATLGYEPTKSLSSIVGEYLKSGYDWFHKKNKDNNISVVPIFKNKFIFWFSEKMQDETIIFGQSLKFVQKFFEEKTIAGTPIWVLSCYQKWLSKSYSIIFDSPCEIQRKACINSFTESITNMRKNSINNVFKNLKDINTWDAFFNYFLDKKMESLCC